VNRFEAMPPRRTERAMPDPAVEREMKELCARLDAMETTQRRTVDAGDVSEAESENDVLGKRWIFQCTKAT
jgi:hypothetical protein